MNYKSQIDAIRSRQKWIEENLNQICDDIRQCPADIVSLIEEHEMYINLLMEEEKLVDSLQPWYRKLLGVPY